jgi:hypothetical protein
VSIGFYMEFPLIIDGEGNELMSFRTRSFGFPQINHLKSVCGGFIDSIIELALTRVDGGF